MTIATIYNKDGTVFSKISYSKSFRIDEVLAHERIAKRPKGTLLKITLN